MYDHNRFLHLDLSLCIFILQHHSFFECIEEIRIGICRHSDYAGMFFFYIQLLYDRNISKNAEMKPIKYNYEERKLKKCIFIKHGFVFIAFHIALSFSVFHFSALYRKGGSTTTCHTMKGLAHLNIDVARGD